MSDNQLNQPEKIYTYREAASFLRVSYPTLRRWVSAGFCPHYKIGNSRVTFAQRHLESIRKEVLPSATPKN